jgi:outer membrane lipoprotein SlyB
MCLPVKPIGRSHESNTTDFSVLLAAACSPDISPDTYNMSAVQQANKVERGIIVGVRQIGVSASPDVATATGAAAGGIAGSQTPGGGVGAAFGALGGSVIGGIVGTAAGHATGDTTAYEYIVREPKGDLVSVTQKDATPLPIGQKVLVIAGKQARIVPDYTVDVETPPSAARKDRWFTHQPAAAGVAGRARHARSRNANAVKPRRPASLSHTRNSRT